MSEVWAMLEGVSWARPFTMEEQQALRVDRNDASTWRDGVFPSSPLGIIGRDVATSPQMWRNRLNPKLFERQIALLLSCHVDDL